MLSLVRLPSWPRCGLALTLARAQDICGDNVWTLEDALAAYCAPEALDDYRNVKGEGTAATRTLHIARAPQLLLIHLKLFAFTERGA